MQLALAEAGCLRIFAASYPARTRTGPSWPPAWTTCGRATTLVVPSLDRLSRSLADPDRHRRHAAPARGRHGAGFKRLHEALGQPPTPGGRLVFHVFAALGEFIRELIVEGTREGLDAARGRGVRLGRPPSMTAGQIRHARDPADPAGQHRLLGRPAARRQRATICKYVPGLPARTRPAAALPRGQE